MKKLIGNFLWAFWNDDKAVKRWIRGFSAAAVPATLQIAFQLTADKGWPTWSLKEWAIRAIPSLVAFAHGAQLSSATKPPAPTVQ